MELETTQTPIISGEQVFHLVDRWGLPLDIVILEFRDRGWAFNVPEFIDHARKAGWPNKRIRWMLKSSCTSDKAMLLINGYLDVLDKKENKTV